MAHWTLIVSLQLSTNSRVLTVIIESDVEFDFHLKSTIMQ